MKKLFITLALAVTAMTAFAAKETITIAPFTGGENVTADELASLRSAVVEAFSSLGRFSIMDSNTDGSTANYEIKGNVVSVAYVYTEHKNDDGSIYKTYEATVNMSLSAINLSNGETISTQSFDSNKNFGEIFLKGWGEETAYTQATALKNASKFMAKYRFPKWIEETFKAQGKILEMDEVKNDNEVKSFLISLGTDDGIKKGQKFDVQLRSIVAGRTRMKVIGEAQCESVEGADISLCKVKKGGKEIYKAFTETPDDLFIQTKK